MHMFFMTFTKSFKKAIKGEPINLIEFNKILQKNKNYEIQKNNL